MKESQHSSKQENDKSMIGATSYVTGKMRFSSAMHIKGKFDGEITNGGCLTIEESGVVKANINLKNAKIEGTLLGNTTASQAVKINEKAKVTGDIHTSSISIQQGAKLKGKISMISSSDTIDIFSARPEQLKKLALKQ